MRILPILLAAGVIGVITLLLVEVRGWRTGRSVISRRQLALRITAGAMLLVLLIAIFAGDYFLGLSTPEGHPVLFLAWWIGCLIIGIGLLFLALADMRHVAERRRQREHEIWRDFARLLAERIRRERGEDKADASDERDHQ